MTTPPDPYPDHSAKELRIMLGDLEEALPEARTQAHEARQRLSDLRMRISDIEFSLVLKANAVRRNTKSTG